MLQWTHDYFEVSKNSKEWPDADEIVLKMILQLHKELGSVYVGFPVIEMYSDAFFAIQSAARLSWENYMRENMYSDVYDIFSFQIMTTTTCNICNLSRNTFTVDQVLKVPFDDDPKKKKKNISELIHDDLGTHIYLAV